MKAVISVHLVPVLLYRIDRRCKNIGPPPAAPRHHRSLLPASTESTP